jgi:hypothetical protein
MSEIDDVAPPSYEFARRGLSPAPKNRAVEGKNKDSGLTALDARRMAMSLVKYLAVGRLVKDEDGTFTQAKHHVVAGLLADNGDAQAKSYKTHVKQIMMKGANKLKPSKRIRLTSDDNDYELHVLAELLDEDEDHILVYFAVTDTGFAKNHSIPKMLDEFKDGFLNQNDASDIRKAKSGGQVNKNSQTLLQSLINKYGSSKLNDVQVKVEEVKGVMQDNVKRALDNVESLEQMESKADDFQNQAKQFKVQAKALKVQERNKYYKVMAALALVFIIIIIIIAVAVDSSTSSSSDDSSRRLLR